MTEAISDRRRFSMMASSPAPASTPASTIFRRNSLAPYPSLETGNRRRLSISTGDGVGLSGSAGSLYDLRRGSSDNAIEDDEESPSSTTSFGAAYLSGSLAGRRMSVGAAQAMSLFSVDGMPDSGNTVDWTSQLRDRARARESFSGKRLSFGIVSPPSPKAAPKMPEMPIQPPQSAPPAKPQRPRPDAFQERILKGDFYMD